MILKGYHYPKICSINFIDFETFLRFLQSFFRFLQNFEIIVMKEKKNISNVLELIEVKECRRKQIKRHPKP